MDSRLLGGIFLIVGTGVGAGTLGLPLAVAESGFLQGVGLLFMCWLVMTLGAFLILEVNMWLPRGNNLVSMAKETLGLGGQSIAWVAYLILLYSLISAYGSVGHDIVHALSSKILVRSDESSWIDVLIFFGLFGSLVWIGIRAVDYSTRGLMSIKLILFFLLITFIFPRVNFDLLSISASGSLISGVTVVLTSFGFAIIMPSLRNYFDDNIVKLRLAILLGSLIPLVLYTAWVALILGVLPREGEFNVLAFKNASEIAEALSVLLSNAWISTLVWTFTTICVLTSFLGVSLALTDFLADGFKVKKEGPNKILIILFTFLPPILMIIFYPQLFLLGLSVAGLACVVLLILLPALMAWSGRYYKKIGEGQYKVLGGSRLPLLFAFVASVYLLYVGLYHDLALFS